MGEYELHSCGSEAGNLPDILCLRCLFNTQQQVLSEHSPGGTNWRSIRAKMSFKTMRQEGIFFEDLNYIRKKPRM